MSAQQVRVVLRLVDPLLDNLCGFILIHGWEATHLPCLRYAYNDPPRAIEMSGIPGKAKLESAAESADRAIFVGLNRLRFRLCRWRS